MKKWGILTIAGLLVFGMQAKAVEWDIDLYGVSYHLNPDEANKHAPRDLHIGSRGQTIFNPGIGLGIDLRRSVDSGGWHGFSLQGKAGWLQDCDAENLYYAGAGIRWRHIFAQKIALDFDLLGIEIYGKDWETGDYNWTFTPYATIGIGYVFDAWGGKRLAKLNVAYVPDNDTISATSGTDLLFISVTLGF